MAMSALLDPSSSNTRTAHADRLRIAQQRADYVVCSKTCELIAVVELDDRTHSSAKDQLRDSRLEQAEIRTVRFKSRAKPTPEAIRAAILQEQIVGAMPPLTSPV
jgi:very-short-patch-repair endonuclease